MDHSKSEAAFARISKRIPGGINTSLRKLDPPIVFSRSEGARIEDVDGNEYLDYHLGFGAVFLGHRDPDVEAAVDDMRQQTDLVGVGTTEIEGQVCDKICEHIPSAEKALLCNSGSEATYTAIRLSRAVTGRAYLIKFQGCYHGWHDYVSMNVTSPAEKIGKYDPISAGMLEEAMQHTFVLPYNSIEDVEKCVRENKGKIACIILEPIAHNVGCILATQEFLAGLRELCSREGIVLIFDEVITGFRHALGGYQSICKVTPDLTTFGKALGNGYPISGLAGRKELMDRSATAGGDVFFAGTFNAHPYSCAAALATIRKLESGAVHSKVFKLGDELCRGIDEAAKDSGIETFSAHFGPVFCTYFARAPFYTYSDTFKNDSKSFVQYRKAMIEKGIFMLPTNIKRNFISAAHTEEDIRGTIEKSRDVFSTLSIAAKP